MKNLSPAARERHLDFLTKFFGREVYIVTEWKDGCVYKTKTVGRVAARMDQPPFKPGSGARQ